MGFALCPPTGNIRCLVHGNLLIEVLSIPYSFVAGENKKRTVAGRISLSREEDIVND